MTFHCKNYDINKDSCKKLKGECVPGRRGCVLEGRVAVSEELAERIRGPWTAGCRRPRVEPQTGCEGYRGHGL